MAAELTLQAKPSQFVSLGQWGLSRPRLAYMRHGSAGIVHFRHQTSVGAEFAENRYTGSRNLPEDIPRLLMYTEAERERARGGYFWDP